MNARLLCEVGPRESVTKREAVYDLVADHIVVDPKQRSPAFLRALSKLYDAALRLAAGRACRALHDPSTRRFGTRRTLMVRRLQSSLSPASLAELNRRLEELSDYIHKQDEPEAGQHLSVTLVLSSVE